MSFFIVKKNSKKAYINESILLHQFDSDSSDLVEFVSSPVPFKIVESDKEKVNEFPEVFEVGLSKYGYLVNV